MSESPIKPPPARRWRRRLVWAACAAALAAGLWFALGWRWWPRVETFPAAASELAARPFSPVFITTTPEPPARQIADALARPIRTVVEKTHRSPRGDPRDYVSLSIYWWPNPLTGLPSIHRDGQRNPAADDYDAPRLRDMTRTVATLASAADAAADQRAVSWLRAWFITPETRMNPHLTFAQMMPGWAAGGRQGIIEGLPLATTLLDAIAQLETRGALAAGDRRELRRWLAEYLAWLRHSRPGRAEAARGNNHGTWHDVQIAALATALGQTSLARETLTAARTRLSQQFLPDGRQPEELRRTKSFDYSAYNLEAWAHLEKLAATHGITLWNHGPAAALRYLEQHVRDWPHPDISPDRAATLKQLQAQVRRLTQPPQPD